MIGQREDDIDERRWRRPPPRSARTQRPGFVQVYITPPTEDDPWGTVETIPADQAAGRTRVGQELNQ